MKYAYWLLFFVFVSLNPAYGDDAGVTTYAQFVRGSPVSLRLNYRGGIKDWDAGASVEDGTLILSNAMFISVTNENNEIIEPAKSKVLNVWADTFFRDPFDLEIDISKFYDLSRPGRYLVRWGCREVMEDSVLVEIVD